jgi:hypothetical protein
LATIGRRRNSVAAFTRIFSAVFVALIFLIVPARADDVKPVISIKTKYVEIETTIDRALASYPALYAKLLAAAKKEAEENRKEAQDAWKDDPTLFRDLAWSFTDSYQLRAAAPPYISVLIDRGEFTGGAHPNTLLDTRLWDVRSNQMVEPESLFRETAPNGPTAIALARLVRDSVIAEKKRRDAFVEDPETDMWLKPLKADLSTLGRPSLTPSTTAGHAAGMTFHFSPYGVGPYAEGSYAAFVPFSALAPYLTDEAKKIFAGERLKSEEDE